MKNKSKNKKNNQNKVGFIWNKETKMLISIIAFVVIIAFLAVAYGFFNYTRTGGANTIGTGHISFSFNDTAAIDKGTVFPISTMDINNTITRDFTITAHTTLPEGLDYRISVVYGDDVSGKTRLRDDVISFKLTPPANANGFTTTCSSTVCSAPTSLTFTNGKAVIATGRIQNTTDLTTKTYSLSAFIDSSKIYVSSTTKRANNTEGNPSFGDTTEGVVSANRYIRNDNNLVSVQLYPAPSSSVVIYTTKEFADSFYSYKILVEAVDNPTGF